MDIIDFIDVNDNASNPPIPGKCELPVSACEINMLAMGPEETIGCCAEDCSLEAGIFPRWDEIGVRGLIGL
jgi:hypothetical protein